jgi:hypothetical protein
MDRQRPRWHLRYRGRAASWGGETAGQGAGAVLGRTLRGKREAGNGECGANNGGGGENGASGGPGGEGKGVEGEEKRDGEEGGEGGCRIPGEVRHPQV